MAAIGVDHVQFSVPSLPTAVGFLEERGWTLSFEQPVFARGDRPYFREPDKSMAYLKRGRDAIELIDASARAGPGQWTPIFDGPLPGAPVADPPGADEAVATHVEALGGTCFCGESEESSLGLEDVVLATSDPEASTAFLQSLGFRADDETAGRRVVFPESFVCMGLGVRIVEGPARASDDVFVDDLGMSLVALISKDLPGDREALQAAGHPTTDIYEYTINGRPIRNVIVHGPGGELVELIEVGRA